MRYLLDYSILQFANFPPVIPYFFGILASEGFIDCKRINRMRKEKIVTKSKSTLTNNNNSILISTVQRFNG
ncbi:MAG: hypothetical protein M3Q77_09755 [Thermoproteota archaeon]|nr:hypothetical protein [Thermoproteota archaeon]